MKKFLLSVCLLTLSLGIKAQSILDMVTYHLVEGTTFHYSHNFSELSNVSFNLPFADDFHLNGTYLEFSLDYETFVWQILRRVGMSLSEVTSHPSEQYMDFYIYENHGVQTTGANLVYDYELDANGNKTNKHISYRMDWNYSGSATMGCTTYIFRVYFYR